MQSATPTAVGSNTARAVHLALLVSRQTVRQVVPHGKWNRVNTSVHAANVTVGEQSILLHLAGFFQPLGALMGLDGFILLAFVLGFPANEIVVPCTVTWAAIQMSSPAGAATETARAKTKSVRSRIERTSTCPTWGAR